MIVCVRGRERGRWGGGRVERSVEGVKCEESEGRKG